MSTSTSSSHHDADATRTDVNESTGAGGVCAEADASISDPQHQHDSGASASAAANYRSLSGAGGGRATLQPSPKDYLKLRESLLATTTILRTAADAFAQLASSGRFLSSILECRSCIEALMTHIKNTEASDWAHKGLSAYQLSGHSRRLYGSLTKARQHLEETTGVIAIDLFEEHYRFSGARTHLIDYITETAKRRRQGGNTLYDQFGTGHRETQMVVKPLQCSLQCVADLMGVFDQIFHDTRFDDTLKTAIGQLKVDIDDFDLIGMPMLRGMQKRQSDGNTLLSAAALLFANTVAQVGNSNLFSTQQGPNNASTRAVQILWTISLALSIVAALTAATAAYWKSDMWRDPKNRYFRAQSSPLAAPYLLDDGADGGGRADMDAMVLDIRLQGGTGMYTSLRKSF
ncbi:unnamed protein product [Tilletia controversa]|nr:unnamed protein product [Tilletia controversa]CAD6942062.1 unnamed protein product [Tilletia controversa]CAD6975469.1 unnamed protein product [Tilletia controversa]